MWGRIRRRGRRLLASVVTSERIGGTVKQRHLFGLGSVPVDADAWQRHRFWCGVMRQINGFGANFLTPADKALVIHNLAISIPRPTLADAQAVAAAWEAEGAAKPMPPLETLQRMHSVLIYTRAVDGAAAELRALDAWAAAIEAGGDA